MGAVPVVLVYPGFEVFLSFFGVLVEPCVGPFPYGGLDEALCLSAGARGVDAGADVLEPEVAVGVAEQLGDEAGAVVGHHAAELDVVPSEVGVGLAQEAAGRDGLFIGHHGDVSHAGVVVDGDVKELPTGSTSLVLWVAGDAVAGLFNARQLLDVDVQQVAREPRARSGGWGSSAPASPPC
jgi:hypothetical protein